MTHLLRNGFHALNIVGWLDSKRKRFGRLAGFPLRNGIQRLHRSGLIEVKHRVELLGQARVEVVARPLRIRTIDNADSALESRLTERVENVIGIVPMSTTMTGSWI